MAMRTASPPSELQRRPLRRVAALRRGGARPTTRSRSRTNACNFAAIGLSSATPDSDLAECAGADPFLGGPDQRGADAAAASCLRDLKIGELGAVREPRGRAGLTSAGVAMLGGQTPV